MKKTGLLASALLLSVAFATSAQAQDYLTGYVGTFDVLDDHTDATQFGIEYRLTPIQYGLRPMIGANVTTDGSTYLYGGVDWDIGMMNNTFFIVPNFAVGAYSESDGKDLGGTLEFRSGIELQYELMNAHRVGVAFNHVSNASIYDKNPGAETLMLTYSLPMGTLLGR